MDLADLTDKIAEAGASQKAEVETLRREKNATEAKALKLKSELIS